jgi:hypothetical protein
MSATAKMIGIYRQAGRGFEKVGGDTKSETPFFFLARSTETGI